MWLQRLYKWFSNFPDSLVKYNQQIQPVVLAAEHENLSIFKKHFSLSIWLVTLKSHYVLSPLN